MKVIDLFSGIGGFSLGLESTGGFETVQFVENNEWCQKILAKNFPGVPITGDIKDYEPKRSERIGLVCGGFPCQPFSVAGKRKGTEDDRHLWPEMLRVIKASKPRWVIGENVRNLTSIQDGLVFEQVCTDLEREGYEVQSFIIPASAVEAPHQRYRVWIVGWNTNYCDDWEKRKVQEGSDSDTNRNGRETNVGYSKHNGSQDRCEETRGEKRESEQGRMLESERTSTQQNVEHSKLNGCSSTKIRGSIKETVRQESQGENRTLDFEGTGSLSETTTNVANSDSEGLQGLRSKHELQKVSKKIKTSRSSTNGRKKDVANSKRTERMAHEGFSVEPSVGRVAHGISKRVDRLKGLGNAIVPQIAYQIGLAILEAEKESN